MRIIEHSNLRYAHYVLENYVLIVLMRANQNDESINAKNFRKSFGMLANKSFRYIIFIHFLTICIYLYLNVS